MTVPFDTRRLVAPELLPWLDLIPSVEIGEDGRVRGGLERPRDMPGLPPELAAISCEDRTIPSLSGAPPVRVLIYRPPASAPFPAPAYLHMHGGGYVLGTADISDWSNRATTLRHGCVTVSVDYRLAPDTRWPGALDDCYAALAWMHREAEALGIDSMRIAIGGESAGGGHAAALALHARDRGEYPICLQLLDSPMLDDRTGTGADPHPHCGEFVWTAQKNRAGWRALLGVEPGGPEVPAAAVPARAADLAGLPSAFILVGGLDLFLEEDMDYARRLLRAGVAAELHVIPGAFHGFGFGTGTSQGLAAARLRDDALARAFGSKNR